MSDHIKQIVLWRPRADEHALAASLGLCEADPDVLAELIGRAIQEIEADTGIEPIVKRWHVWRVVRVMARHGLVNTPDGRAAAFALLNGGDDDQGD